MGKGPIDAKRISIYCDKSIVERMDEYAKKMMISRNAVFNLGMTAFFENEEMKKSLKDIGSIAKLIEANKEIVSEFTKE